MERKGIVHYCLLYAANRSLNEYVSMFFFW
nr:MAG TPA: hypothetical protein [Caudoviricetes sp.]